MTAYTSSSNPNKTVNVYQNHDRLFRAMYVQTYKNEQQVLQVKEFRSLELAKRWAFKVLEQGK